MPRKINQFIGALLAHRTLDDAAAAIGIGRATAWRWINDPVIAERIRAARREALDHAIARIQQAATQAVDTLCDVQTSGESESACVTAARVILEMALHTVELEAIEKRISALEQIAKSGNWKGVGNDQPNHTQVGAARTINGRA